MDFLGAAVSQLVNYITCSFDLCPLLEGILYSLQSFGGIHLSVIPSLEVICILEVEMY